MIVLAKFGLPLLQVARLGADQGCTEALLTLGDKPELRWPQAAQELRDMGFASTLDYVYAAAGRVLAETGLLPHINAGVMGVSKRWSYMWGSARRSGRTFFQIVQWLQIVRCSPMQIKGFARGLKAWSFSH